MVTALLITLNNRESDIFYEKSITNSFDFAENKTSNNIDIVYSNNNIVFIKMARISVYIFQNV